MDHIPFSAWVAFGALIFTIMGATGTIIWAIVWKLSENKDTLNSGLKDISKAESERRHALRAEIMSKIAEISLDASKEQEFIRRAVTEFEKATNARMNAIDMYIRDKYVLKEDFRDDLGTITKIIDTLGTRIEKRLESFEEKLDKLQQFNNTKTV